MKLSKPFQRQLFHYAENFFHELLSNIHQINCPTPIGRTKSRPLTCCVISLAQYMSTNHRQFPSISLILISFPHFWKSKKNGYNSIYKLSVYIDYTSYAIEKLLNNAVVRHTARLSIFNQGHNTSHSRWCGEAKQNTDGTIRSTILSVITTDIISATNQRFTSSRCLSRP